MTDAIYNTIGKTYDTTCKPDAEILKTLLGLIQPRPNSRYIDVTCGSGNYTHALAQTGLNIEAIDISEGRCWAKCD